MACSCRAAFYQNEQDRRRGVHAFSMRVHPRLRDAFFYSSEGSRAGNATVSATLRPSMPSFCGGLPILMVITISLIGSVASQHVYVHVRTPLLTRRCRLPRLVFTRGRSPEAEGVSRDETSSRLLVRSSR